MAPHEHVLLIPESQVVEITVFVISTDDSDKKRAVEVGLFECPNCHGTVGVDVSYIHQVTEAIACPYCRELLMITEG